MKSSPEPLNDKTINDKTINDKTPAEKKPADKKPSIARVMLPSFEQMLRYEGIEPPREPEAEAPGPGVKQNADKKEIDKTKELCANMRREALSEADRIIKQATQEAYAIRDKARRETVAKLQKEADEERKTLRASIQKAVKAFHDEQEAIYNELEPYFLDIALHISESILHYELLRDENAYLSIVRNALSLYRSDGKERTLYLPPKGYALLVGDDGKGPFMQQMHDTCVRVEMDKRMAEGDCMLESSIGGVRAGVVTQLSRLRYAASPEKDE